MNGERLRQHQVSWTGWTLAGIATAYALLILVTNRGDLAAPAVLHAAVACGVVGLISLTRRMHSTSAIIALLLVAVVVALIWVYLAFIGLFLFSCGQGGCFA